MRDHWRELGFWRWWWHHRVPAGAKFAAITAAVAVFLSGGFFAANRLASASAGLSTGAY